MISAGDEQIGRAEARPSEGNYRRAARGCSSASLAMANCA
jgi:hypothetical protein